FITDSNGSQLSLSLSTCRAHQKNVAVISICSTSSEPL
ncbi:MAG: hypothetical protein ACI8VY_000991, partial [Cellvibrionaceae bacterium]